MSFYATIQATLAYPDKESFNQVVKVLQDGKWMDEDGHLLDECGNRLWDEDGAEPNIDQESLTIEIPCCHYRNLSKVDFFLNEPTLQEKLEGKKPTKSKVEGTAVGTSTDGCFSGWIIENGVETGYDLEKWAADNLEGDDAIPPTKEECNDEDDYDQNLCDWQALVEQEFHDF